MIINEQNEGKLKAQFGKWYKYWVPFIETDAFDQIFRELKSRKKGITAPESKDVFRVFEVTDPDNLKVILCGICPYHTFIDKKPVADGLMMSSKYTNRLQPSLWNLYSAWEKEYSGMMDPDMWQNTDLEYLSKQGVLLYNIALTVQENKALSDNSIWFEFNKFFWTEIISKYFKGLCIVYLGQQAHKSASYINPMQHYHWNLSHPAAAAYNGTEWDSKGTFKKIDQIITENNGPEHVVKWYLKKPEPEYPSWVTQSMYKAQDKDIPSAESLGMPWKD